MPIVAKRSPTSATAEFLFVFIVCCCTLVLIGEWMCAFVLLGLVFPYQGKRMAWGTSRKWSILRRAECKTTTESINQCRSHSLTCSRRGPCGYKWHRFLRMPHALAVTHQIVLKHWRKLHNTMSTRPTTESTLSPSSAPSFIPSLLIGRIAVLRTKMRSIVVDRVAWSVGLSVTVVSPAKNGWTDRDAVWVQDSRNHILDGSPDLPMGRGNLERRKDGPL